jgi:hypothetical protein
MVEESAALLLRVVPLPIALYDSNGLLFELYQGGQPSRYHHIVWERLKPIGEEALPGATGESSSGIHE